MNSLQLGLLFGLGLVACHTEPRRDAKRELDQCLVISQSGQELTRCLVTQHDWSADSASQAGSAFQGHLDSIEANLLAMRAAAVRRAEDSLQHVQDSIRAKAIEVAAGERRAREATFAAFDKWASCVLRLWRAPHGTGENWIDPCSSLFPGRKLAVAYLEGPLRARPADERTVIDEALAFQLDKTSRP